MSARPTAVVIGAGPGLGMPVARRFGREGYAVALISRSADRHAGYLASLEAAGVEASAHAADVRDDDRLAAALDAVESRHDRIDVMYYGAAAVDMSRMPVPITDIHAYVSSHPEEFGEATGTLDPDDIAEAAGHLYTDRDHPEAIFTAQARAPTRSRARAAAGRR